MAEEERRPRNPANRLQPGAQPAAPASKAKGDVPSTLLDRYLIERDGQGRAERFYRDARSPDPAFRDFGNRLETRHAYPDTIGDMLKVAEHRGWRSLRVEGEEAFRRDVWIQAKAKGLEVVGYNPRQRDRQAAGEPLDPAGRESPRWDRALQIAERLLPEPDVRRGVVEAVTARVSSREHRSRERDERRR